MPVQWSETKQTEIKGLNHVQYVVNQAGSIFNQIDGTNDIGLDGYIEFIEERSPTGLCIGVQIKAGNSNLSGKAETISFRADKNHFEYWHNHILPVIAIVYIPKNDTAYWIDITQYLVDNEELIDSGPYTVTVPEGQIFDSKGFSLFHYKLRKYLSSYGDDKFFGRSLKMLADLNNAKNRYDAIKSLFSFHRNKLEAWYFLVTRFCFEDDEKLQIALIYAFRHLLTHGDIWWHPGNEIESTISKEARQLIPAYFGLEETSKLLDQIHDESGISRGTIGYDVHLILRLLPERIEYFKKIILQNDTADEKRFWSGVCLINEFQQYDLERAINFAQSMITNFPGTEYSERFSVIKETLLEFEFLDFTG